MNDLLTPTVWQSFAGQVLLYLPALGAGLVLFVVFWLAGTLTGRIISRVGNLRRVNQDAVSILASSAKAALILLGAVTALGTLGVDVKALVTGLGLTGFALGFALKDIISNALAGILILIYEPFRRGDRIAVSGLEGTVTNVTLRYTTLDGGDKRMLVPNANLFTNPITVLRGSGDVAPIETIQ